MHDRSAAIQVDGLSKSYKKIRVLEGVSFTVERGSIFALLGANGAGKTTMINILTTLLPADGGAAKVAGYDVAKQADKVRRNISLTGQFAAVDDMLSARENLLLIAELRHVGHPAETASTLLEQFDLVDAADRRVATFSGGMRRRLDIAMSLIGTPSIIFLDEPTTGLDPQSRNMMWAQIKSLANAGTTIFLTTQYLEEADQLADKIAILAGGKIAAIGTPDELKKVVPHSQIALTFSTADDLQKATKLFAAHSPVVNSETNTMTLQIGSDIAKIAALFTKIQQAHLAVEEFSQKTPTLDDAFLKIINDNQEKKR